MGQNQRLSGKIIGSPAAEKHPAQISRPKPDLLTVMDVVTATLQMFASLESRTFLLCNPLRALKALKTIEYILNKEMQAFSMLSRPYANLHTKGVQLSMHLLPVIKHFGCSFSCSLFIKVY